MNYNIYNSIQSEIQKIAMPHKQLVGAAQAVAGRLGRDSKNIKSVGGLKDRVFSFFKRPAKPAPTVAPKNATTVSKPEVATPKKDNFKMLYESQHSTTVPKNTSSPVVTTPSTINKVPLSQGHTPDGNQFAAQPKKPMSLGAKIGLGVGGAGLATGLGVAAASSSASGAAATPRY